MNTMFLSTEELIAMTGYQRQADQRRWLTSHGWMFEQTANGKPVVLKSYCEAKLSESTTRQPARPNFASIQRAA